MPQRTRYTPQYSSSPSEENCPFCEQTYEACTCGFEFGVPQYDFWLDEEDRHYE